MDMLRITPKRPTPRTRLTCLTGAILVVAASLAQAASADRDRDRDGFRAKVAGTCTNKDDFSFTGAATGFYPGGAFRIHCVLTGDSSLGRLDAQILAELRITGDGCSVPGASGLLATVTGYVLVFSLADTQEQLFLTLKDGSECLTPPGTAGPGTVQLTVTGGTGRFGRAGGTVVNKLAPIALAFSALGGDGFVSAFSGTFEGDVVLR